MSSVGARTYASCSVTSRPVVDEPGGRLLVRRAPALAPVDPAQALDVDPTGRRHEHQPADPLGLLECHPQCEHPAHGLGDEIEDGRKPRQDRAIEIRQRPDRRIGRIACEAGIPDEEMLPPRQRSATGCHADASPVAPGRKAIGGGAAVMAQRFSRHERRPSAASAMIAPKDTTRATRRKASPSDARTLPRTTRLAREPTTRCSARSAAIGRDDAVDPVSAQALGRPSGERNESGDEARDEQGSRPAPVERHGEAADLRPVRHHARTTGEPAHAEERARPQRARRDERHCGEHEPAGSQVHPVHGRGLCIGETKWDMPQFRDGCKRTRANSVGATRHSRGASRPQCRSARSTSNTMRTMMTSSSSVVRRESISAANQGVGLGQEGLLGVDARLPGADAEPPYGAFVDAREVEVADHLQRVVDPFGELAELDEAAHDAASEIDPGIAKDVGDADASTCARSSSR